MEKNFTTAITEDLSIRAYALDSTDIVNTAAKIHNTSRLACAALGRTLTAASMMGAMLKGDNDSLTLQIRGNGPLGAIICVSDSTGNVRGYVQNPSAELPLNTKNGKINVGAGVGEGSIIVIKDEGLKEPYSGNVPLVSGEIAEDVTQYFAISEQIPTVCALGVLVSADLTVVKSGGYIIQLLPFVEDDVVTLLEQNINDVIPVTKMLNSGMTPADMLRKVLSGFNVKILQEHTVSYKCYCNKECVEKALISMGREELEKLICEQGEAELTCQFCDNIYNFSKNDLVNMLNKLKQN